MKLKLSSLKKLSTRQPAQTEPGIGTADSPLASLDRLDSMNFHDPASYETDSSITDSTPGSLVADPFTTHISATETVAVNSLGKTLETEPRATEPASSTNPSTSTFGVALLSITRPNEISPDIEASEPPIQSDASSSITPTSLRKQHKHICPACSTAYTTSNTHTSEPLSISIPSQSKLCIPEDETPTSIRHPNIVLDTKHSMGGKDAKETPPTSLEEPGGEVAVDVRPGVEMPAEGILEESLCERCRNEGVAGIND